jgi:hypothetical protein
LLEAAVLSDLAAAGLVISKEKCLLSCSHVVRFLGFVIDTLFGQFRLTALQKRKLQIAIARCVRNPTQVPAKLLARVTGLVTSLSLVTGPVSGLFSRFLHRALNSRKSWYDSVSLDSSALAELRFWDRNLAHFESRSIWKNHSLLRVIYYNTGGQGWGGYLQIGAAFHQAHGSWAPDEVHAVRSSTWRKLSALLRLLRVFRHLLSDCTVIARGDAQNVFWILFKGGSALEHIQMVCLKIFQHCLKLRIDLQPEWLPREENEFADYLFKIRDVDDFGLAPSAFGYIQSLYGPFSVDRFASSHNAKLPPFDSFYWCPGASACNTFSQDWGGDYISYCFPPPHFVARTLQHALACRARIVLIALGWRSAWWWRLLCGSAEFGLGFATFVRRHLYFPASWAVLIPGEL